MATKDPLSSGLTTTVSEFSESYVDRRSGYLQLAFKTEPSGGFGGQQSAARSVAPNPVLQSMEGVVIQSSPDKVLVKFRDVNLVAPFPRELFLDESLTAYGTPLVYEIVESPSGHRSQRFRLGQSQPDVAALSELEQVLAEVKYR